MKCVDIIHMLKCAEDTVPLFTLPLVLSITSILLKPGAKDQVMSQKTSKTKILTSYLTRKKSKTRFLIRF